MLNLIFNRIIEMSLVGSIIVVMIMMSKFVFKDKFSPKWHYFIWFILLLKLMMPVDLESNFGIMPQINIQKYVEESMSMTIDSDDQPQDLPIEEFGEKKRFDVMPKATHTNESPVKFLTILERLWAAIALALLFIKITFEWLFLMKQRKTQILVNPMINELLRELKDDVGIKRHVDVCIEKMNNVPRVYGLIRPRIIISEQVLYSSDKSRLRHILLHELSHIKQNDILVNIMKNLLFCLYFFNPIIIWGLKRMAVDCESACDARVLKILTPKQHRNYGYTLISLISQLDNKSNALALSLGHKKNVIRRLKMISAYKKTPFGYKVISMLVAGMVIVTCLLVPNANAENNVVETHQEMTLIKENATVNTHEIVDVVDTNQVGKEIDLQEYIFPVENIRITSPYGIRVNAITGEEKLHTGVDLAAVIGTDIYAFADGTVVYVDRNQNSMYGKFLMLEHDNGMKTMYAHCNSISVEAGDSVTKGQKIATVGNTGQSTGPHLHFEVQKNDEPIDPMTLFGHSE